MDATLGQREQLFLHETWRIFPEREVAQTRQDIVQTRRPPFRMLARFEGLVRLGSRKIAAAELNVAEGIVTEQLRSLEQGLHTPRPQIQSAHSQRPSQI